MGVLVVSGHAQVWHLIVLQALGGAAVAFYSPAFYGLTREIVGPERMQQANSYLGIARYAAFPLGAATGGTIVALIGSGEALLVDAATYGTSALLLAAIHVREPARAAGESLLQGLRVGWQAFVEHAWVPITTVWIALYFLITYAPFFVLGPVASKQWMSGAGSWAIIVTGEGVGALLGSLAGLRIEPRRRPMVVTVLLFMTTAIQSVLLAYHAPVPLIAAAAALAGFAFAFGSIIWDTSIQRTIAPEKLARVGAYGWMVAMVFLPAGYALAGPIAEIVGLRNYLLAGAVWVVASTLVVIRLRPIREFTTEETPQAIAVNAAT
jgi:MFS family permease